MSRITESLCALGRAGMSEPLLIRHGFCDGVGRILVGRSGGIHLNAAGASAPTASTAGSARSR
jgi:hypothetical protein